MPIAPLILIYRWLLEAESVVVLTGAGMSAESGIPTFRDAKNGLWSKFDAASLATAQAFRNDKELVWGWYVWRMAMVRCAQPNSGHLALAKLARLKLGLTIVTQNVDDLHERAGSPDVIHLHGSLFSSRCFACARPSTEFELPPDAASSPALRETPPRCIHCGGYIRPGVVWFGEPLPVDGWKQAVERAKHCDLLLAIGTSGVVQPAAGLPRIAKASGTRVVEINPVETELSNDMDLVWRAPATQALSELHSLLDC